MNGRCSIPVPKGSNGEILWNEIFVAKDKGLVWKYDRRRVKAGQKAGTRQKNGYIAVYVCGKLYYAHRIVWEMHNGPIPEGKMVDHVDHDRENNDINNLRLVDDEGNTRNVSLRGDNKSGCPGVCFDNERQKWLVTICGKHIGRFDTLFEAICARKSKNEEYGFHKNHGK